MSINVDDTARWSISYSNYLNCKRMPTNLWARRVSIQQFCYSQGGACEKNQQLNA